MASKKSSSRTGTAHWKNLRTKIKAEARAEGQTNCPICNVWLNWKTAKQPRSVEVDHKRAVASGGTDEPDNLWCICRNCNVRKDASPKARDAKKRTTRTETKVFVNPRW